MSEEAVQMWRRQLAEEIDNPEAFAPRKGRAMLISWEMLHCPGKSGRPLSPARQTLGDSSGGEG